MICKSSLIKSKGVFDGRKQWRCQKQLLENSEKIQLCKFQLIGNSFCSIKCTFRFIEEESRTDQVKQKLHDEILHCLDWLRVPLDRSNVNFDRSNRHRESIEQGRTFVMNFFIFRSIEKRFDWLKALNFEFSLVFY